MQQLAHTVPHGRPALSPPAGPAASLVLWLSAARIHCHCCIAGMSLLQSTANVSFNNVTPRLYTHVWNGKGGRNALTENGYLLNFVINVVTQCTAAARELLAYDPLRAVVLP